MMKKKKEKLRKGKGNVDTENIADSDGLFDGMMVGGQGRGRKGSGTDGRVDGWICRSFIHSFVRSFVRSFIHSFIS